MQIEQGSTFLYCEALLNVVSAEVDGLRGITKVLVVKNMVFIVAKKNKEFLVHKKVSP